MDCTRNKIANEIICFFKTLGIDVHTTTKAHGHQGFFRLNRIDISKNIKHERLIPTLLHEFAHYIIYNINTNCKDFTPIFKLDCDFMYSELNNITNFVDKNATCEHLYIQKENIKKQMKYHENIIKNKYPQFKKNDKFKPFQKFSRFSVLKHLEKYDSIKILKWFHYETYSIINIEKDFPDIPNEFVSYLKLKSYQRKQASLSRKINKIQKYYKEPGELFARFIECLYIDIEMAKELAPQTYLIFKNLYNEEYYSPLNQLFNIVNISL